MSHKIIPVDEAPERKYTKGSIYDDVLDAFKEGMKETPLARIEMTKKDGLKHEGPYLTGRLRRRIKERPEDYSGIQANTINGECYLRKSGE